MIVKIPEYDDEYNSYREITENPIILDLSQCRYWSDVHLLLKEKFGFPEYYGKNWSTLWDCLDGLFANKDSWEVHIYGYRSMPQEWQDECVKMLEIFDDVHKRTPNFSYKLIS